MEIELVFSFTSQKSKKISFNKNIIINYMIFIRTCPIDTEDYREPFSN